MLWLWPSWGDLSWLDLPQPADCVVWFPARSLHEGDATLRADGLPVDSNAIRRQQDSRRRRAPRTPLRSAKRDKRPADSQDDQRVDGDDVMREANHEAPQRYVPTFSCSSKLK